MKKFFYLLLTLWIIFPLCCLADDKNNLERKWTTDNWDTVRCIYLSMDWNDVWSIDIDWWDWNVESALVTSEWQVTIICHEYTSQQNYSVTMEWTTTWDDFNYVWFVDQHVTEITAWKSDTLDYFVVAETWTQIDDSTYSNMVSNISWNHWTVENVAPELSNPSTWWWGGWSWGGWGNGGWWMAWWGWNWWWGWGWWSNPTTSNPNNWESNTWNDSSTESWEVVETPTNNLNPQEVLSNGYTRELNDAYVFAFKNGITTMKSIDQANMNWSLNRIAMAKMLSQYAINILKKKPDTTKKCNFWDVTAQMDSDYSNWVTLACQLWIMWINMLNNEFRPNDDVIRSEFGTALSRMLYGLADWTDNYYSTHLAKLKKEWIISNDNPTLSELRWYVMLMLMRSAK